jgi:hypothetical protein
MFVACWSPANPVVVFTGKPSDVYNRCLQEVQSISCATLFAPVLRIEAVQAMSVFSWCDGEARLIQYSPCVWVVGQWLAERWPCR